MNCFFHLWRREIAAYFRTSIAYVIGVLSYSRSDLERLKGKGEKVKLAVVGLLHLHDDITAEVAAEVIESVQVRGIFIASEAVRAALAGKMK